MSNAEHEEFDDLKPKPVADVQQKLREKAPLAMAAIDELDAIFGGGGQVLRLVEPGVDIKAKTYRADDDFYGCVTASAFIRMGELSRQNSQDIADREAARAKK